MRWFYVLTVFFILPGLVVSIVPFLIQLAVGIVTEKKHLRNIPTFIMGAVLGMNAILCLMGARTYHMLGFGYVSVSDQTIVLMLTPFCILAIAAARAVSNSSREAALGFVTGIKELISGGSKKVLLRLGSWLLLFLIILGCFFVGNLFTSGRYRIEYVRIVPAEVASVEVISSQTEESLHITDRDQIEQLAEMAGSFGLVLGEPLSAGSTEYAQADKLWLIFRAEDESLIYSMCSINGADWLIGSYFYKNIGDAALHQQLQSLLP